MGPEFWSLEELESLKAELPVSKWNAQYQQDPTSEEGALIKREWWQEWTENELPPCECIIQSWDTAFLKTQRAIIVPVPHGECSITTKMWIRADPT